MRTIRLAALVLSATGLLCAPIFAQQHRKFMWKPANDETVQLDPANFHAGRTYHPGPNGGGMHVDIQSQKPVTIFMTNADAWRQAMSNPQALANLPQYCVREHVVETTYVCQLPPEDMTLVVRDERYSPTPSIIAGINVAMNADNRVTRALGIHVASVLSGSTATSHKLTSPNDVHIQYYRWACIENCVQPEFQWIEQVREKYKLTAYVKVYGGFVPDHDGTQVSIRIKSPVPMIVAMLPSDVADQLHARPDALESALEKDPCQQRAAQRLEFQCTFNMADGPQSLVVVAEGSGRVPHKNAEVEMSAVKCVDNCELIQDTDPPASGNGSSNQN
jgi:hypothetical protein